MIEACIWDFGGTLFDTLPITIKSFLRALNDEKVESDSKKITELLSISEEVAIKYFKDNYKISDNFVKNILTYNSNINLQLIKPNNYAKEICEYNTKNNIKNFIISFRDNSLFEYLRYYSMLKYFTEIITSDSNIESKPSPQGIEYIVNKYKMNKDNVIIIGDREFDIKAGKNAGIKTCCLLNEFVGKDIEADYLINNLGDLFKIII